MLRCQEPALALYKLHYNQGHPVERERTGGPSPQETIHNRGVVGLEKNGRIRWNFEGSDCYPGSHKLQDVDMTSAQEGGPCSILLRPH